MAKKGKDGKGDSFDSVYDDAMVATSKPNKKVRKAAKALESAKAVSPAKEPRVKPRVKQRLQPPPVKLSKKERKRAAKLAKKQDKQLRLFRGDCVEILRQIPADSIDAIVTDPPYGLKFMAKAWDYQVPQVDAWQEILRVLKPGGFLLCFAGTRTQHRMCVNIEDAGFEIRDMIAWVYGSGFPKGCNISKAIDKAAGVEIKQWEGFDTALKPAFEPITLARKPFKGTVANNVLTYGVGGLNIDGCRVGTEDRPIMVRTTTVVSASSMSGESTGATNSGETTNKGRYPANLIHDGSDEVLELFPSPHGAGSKRKGGEAKQDQEGGLFGVGQHEGNGMRFGDSGSAARFFYCAKASKKDRGEGNKHLTVKPTDLMRYLVRLVIPPGGVVLDPYMGSGSTGKAALLEKFRFVGIELEKESYKIAKKRIKAVR